MLTIAMRWDLFLLFLSMTKTSNTTVENIFYEHFTSKKSNGGLLISPNWPEKYPQNVRYVYVFMGSGNQQVHLTFEHFNIEGLSDSCEKDYLDIYIEVKSVRDNINISNVLFHEPLLGRFCGHNLNFIPHHIVSKNNVIILDFFSDKNTQLSYNQDDHMGRLGFQGKYFFRINDMLTTYWASSHHSSCFFLIHANSSETGVVLSPTYPGLLPSPLKCIYEFRSESSKARIRLDFIDFNLYEQSDMELCPVEFVEIIDHDQIDSNSIGIGDRLCGVKNNFHFFSSKNRLFLRLIVLAGRNYMMEPRNIDLYKTSLQNTGFKIKFTFSDKYEPLNTLSNKQYHVPGTECDIKIQSTDKIEDEITSPGVSLGTLTPKVCNYFFFGIHNTQNMEVVQINFTYLNLPQMEHLNCSDGSLSIYSVSFKMKNAIKRYRTVIKETKPDQVLCGKSYSKYSFTSKNPVLILKLNLTQPVRKELQGFKLSYRFVQDFGISGKMVTRGVCHYKYQSDETGFRGLINSPLYSNFYPSNSSCQYDFFAKPNEMIRLIFNVFQTSEDVPAKLTTYHDVHLSCHQDYLTVSEIVRLNTGFIQTNKTERYCGTSIPGLLVSQQNSIGFTLTFKSDSQKNGPGFLASYQFIKKRKVFSNQCGSNISTFSYYGYISSPNYPGRYTSDLICEWHLHALSPTERFILMFISFQIEGTTKSCSNAVLRIYEGNNVQPQSELCGTDSAIPSYFSSSNFIRVRFLTDIQTRGARGFQIVWTRIIPRLMNGTCPGFLCLNSGHCINKNLTCNKVYNCGSYVNHSGLPSIDTSDEIYACPVAENYTYLYSGLGIVAIILLILIFIVIYFIQKNKYLLKRKLRSMENLDDFVEQHYPSPNISLKKEISIQTPSGSLKIIPKRQLNDSSDNFLFKNHELINRCRQFSLDLVDTSSKTKRTDNFDSMSEYGLLFREKMQKISIV